MKRTPAPAEDIIINNELGIITTGDIQRCIDEYTDLLPNPDDLYDKNKTTFNGLLRHIYKHCIRYIVKDNLRNDYELYDKIFNLIYLNLVSMYGRVPSIYIFTSCLIDIDINNVIDIKSGMYRKDNTKVNINHQRIITKWDNICRSYLVDYTVHSNSIGGMFRLKNYGFTDQQPIQLELHADQIATIDERQLSALIAENRPQAPEN